MNEFVKQLIRAVLIAGAVILAAVVPWLFIPAGFVAGITAGLFMQNIGRGNALREERRARKFQEKQFQNQLKEARIQKRDLYYTKHDGWKVEELPHHLSVSAADRRSPDAVMDLAGMKGLVMAHHGQEGASFELRLRDGAKVEDVARQIEEKKYNAAIRRLENGTVVVVSDDPHAIASLGMTAYPFRGVDYRRELTHERQYVVSGCSSYDEALEKFRKNPEAYDVVNSRVSMRESIDGRPVSESVSGELLDKVSVRSLPTDAFIITEASVVKEGASVMVPGDLIGAKEISEYASVKASGMRKEDMQTERTVSYSDGMPEGLVKKDGVAASIDNSVSASSVDAIISSDVVVYLRCNSAEELERIARTGKLPAGCQAFVGKVPPVPSGDTFVVSMPLKEVRDVLSCSSNGTRKPEDAEYKEMSRLISGGVPVEVTLRDDIASDRLSIGTNGAGTLPLKELHDRLNHPGMDGLETERVGTWVKEASRIESVNINVDTLTNTMYVTSQVNGIKKTEKVELTREEALAMHERLRNEGGYWSVEKKDVLMQSHPDFFKTYRAVRSSASVQPKSIYKDPLRDFLSGRAPERRVLAKAKAMARQMKKEKKTEKTSTKGRTLK